MTYLKYDFEQANFGLPDASNGIQGPIDHHRV
jgi:hypothetical protein